MLGEYTRPTNLEPGYYCHTMFACPASPVITRIRSLLALVGALFLLLSCGCTVDPLLRVEQAEIAGERLQFVVSAQRSVHPVDSSASYADRRCYLLEWPVAGPMCGAGAPTRVIDLNMGLGALNQRPGRWVDFHYGADPNRIVQRMVDAKGATVRLDVAVLGPGADGRWAVLRQWRSADPIGHPAIIPSARGRYLVLTDPPRVFDTQTLLEFPANDALAAMLRTALSHTARPTEFRFADDLSVAVRVSHRTQAPHDHPSGSPGGSGGGPA